jgi:tetratricopeptide (TPR) repeat protein
MVGPIEEVIPLQERALRLDPRDPLIGNMYGRIGAAYLLQSYLDEAVVWLEKARDANPLRYPPHASLAAAYGLKGEIERAAAELAEASRLVRRPVLEHRPPEKHWGTLGPQDGRATRGHLYHRLPQGRHGGGVIVTATGSRSAVRERYATTVGVVLWIPHRGLGI